MMLSPLLKSLSFTLDGGGAMHIFNSYHMHLTFCNCYFIAWLQGEQTLKKIMKASKENIQGHCGN